MTITGSTFRPDRPNVAYMVASSTMFTSSVPSTAAHTGAMLSCLAPKASAMATKLSGCISTMSWAYTVLIELRVASSKFTNTGLSGVDPRPPCTVHGRGPHMSRLSITSLLGAS